MARIMTKYIDEDISFMRVKEKWYLGTRGECYSPLSSELRSITTILPPIEKMLFAGENAC